MITDPETFDLGELAGAAGVTPRTVRYYVQQGLIPSPGTRGPGTRYDRSHLDRLQLIKRLQREHLPLSEIRRRLEELSDDRVREALRFAPETRNSSALAYVRGVLGSASGREHRHARGPREPESIVALAAPAKPASRSTWERIALAPDVELHVRRPLSREQNRLVERLLEAARHLFKEEL